MFEHRNEPVLPRHQYLYRMARHSGFAAIILAGSLGMGMTGYHIFEGMTWIDSLLNASMLLGGMGPVDAIHTTGGKIFASFYALYSGVIFLVVAGVLIVPVVHRLLHRFHAEMKPDR